MFAMLLPKREEVGQAFVISPLPKRWFPTILILTRNPRASHHNPWHLY